MDAIQPADPDGGFLGAVLQVAGAQVFALCFPVHPPGVMRLVVDDQHVAGIGHLAQDLAGVGLVALDAALVHAAALFDLFFAFPGQGVPIMHQHLALAQFVQEGGGHNAKGIVVVAFRRRFQYLEPALDRESRSDDQHVPGKAGILGVGDLVQDVPGDEHGHDDGLAGAGGHFAALAHNGSTVIRDGNAHPFGGRRFGQPDERLYRLQLAEEKTPRLELFRVVPVLQQPPGDAADARIARLAPGIDARANLVDQRDLFEEPRVIEGFGALRGHHVARRAAAVHQVEEPRLALVAPVTRWFTVRRVDDEAVDGCRGHQSTSGATNGSSAVIRAGRSC